MTATAPSPEHEHFARPPTARERLADHAFRWTTRLLAGFTLLVVALVVTFTSSRKTGQEVPAAGGVYVEGAVGHPTYLNPLLAAFNDADDDVASLAFSGLTRLSRDGTVVPDLSTAWTVSPDGLVYTFTMRDATWQDGQPVTADDVVFTIGLLRDPAYNGPFKGSWNEITVRKVNTQSVQFTLKTALGDFLQLARQPLLPSHLLKTVPIQALTDSAFSAAPVGAGPYQLLEWDSTMAILLRVGSGDTSGPSASPGPSASAPASARVESASGSS